MKFCAVQIPYAHQVSDAPASVEYLISQLNKCDVDCDLILTPEYSNMPAAFPLEEGRRFVDRYTPELVAAAKSTAIRCQAIVAVNFLCEVEPGVFRNTTRVFDRSGNVAGDFYKQHLPMSEKRGVQPDYSYTRHFSAPEIVEVDGIRLGFLICYDTYFNEYIAHLAYRKPDVVLVSSFQRGERQDILEMLNKNLAFSCNSFVLRASVSMGENAETGGMSMAVDPSGRIIAEFGNKTGLMECEVDDIHYKYMRSNAFGGAQIANDKFISNGRTPWSYRPAGSMICEGDKDMPYPRICAHRGFPAGLPENTIAGLGSAVAMGADEIEMDVRFTADGIPVICHDPDLERVSNGSGELENFTLAELKELDFGGRRGAQFAGMRIATLEEVLAKFARHAVINMHLKSVDGQPYPESRMQVIVELLTRYDQLEHVYFMGSADVMECAIQVAPDIPRCMACFPEPDKIIERAVKYQCRKLQFFASELKPGMIEEAHRQGLKCNLFFCDDGEKAKEYFASGIDTILTNDCLAVMNAAGKLR